MIPVKDIAWAAGFIEGEGYVHSARHSPAVECTQVQLEPLERLQRVFGGSISFVKRTTNNPKWQDYYRWQCYRKTAAAALMTIFCLMSPKRQAAIAKVLEVWKAAPIKGAFNRNKTQCKRGHLFTPENTYPKRLGTRQYRQCRICQQAAQARYRLAKGA